jgi:hypothetical protein
MIPSPPPHPLDYHPHTSREILMVTDIIYMMYGYISIYENDYIH